MSDDICGRVSGDILGDISRRRALKVLAALTAAIPVVHAFGAAALAHPSAASAGVPDSAHDFDFLIGRWQVHHRRLKKRLANNHDWEEFDGTTEGQHILGGFANFNDSITTRGGTTSHGMGLRAFNAKSGNWYDWYLAESNPTDLGVPGIGRFSNGVGTFLSDEIFEGRPVKVRGTWSHVTRTSWQWEQAFSPDDGKTWETNWVMLHTRIE